MPDVQYGNTTIEYSIQLREELKTHYITVDADQGVVLKGREIAPETADKLILKKARWILNKLELVRSVGETEIVTGSRIPYLGRKYYAEVIFREGLPAARVEFNYSKFRIYVPVGAAAQPLIQAALDDFYTQKAIQKITPRIKKWARQTGLTYRNLRFQKMEKRWGSCTPLNTIVINTEAIKLPFSLIDYLILHELVHTQIKDHSKAFWAELSRYLPDWKEKDIRMGEMKL